MRIRYDSETDTLTIVFRETVIVESDEEKPGVILDYDADGEVAAIEFLDASQRFRMPIQVDLVGV
ncbi:MAG: DUF2283 domain-containing protein, partial [Abditibacteriales bacterium]|nr:DUF2283 domain-containing protein [Abditibacteriales bacterium]